MVPSEELELKLFLFAESAGKARWRPTEFTTLLNAAQFHEDSVLVDALLYLHARGFMEFRHWSSDHNDWVLYGGRDREYFYRPFEIRVTFPGRKYFEGLEAQSTERSRSVPTGESRLGGTAQGTAARDAKPNSSPQVIATPEPTPPKAFISHSGQDRQFVEKFAADLRDVGVDAWYSKWEIKAGDAIPEKIDEGIEKCGFFIIVLSWNSIKAPWVQTELQAAIARKISGKVRKIIPIKIDDCDDFPPIIGMLYREDFTNQPYELGLRRVQDSIFDEDVRPQLGKRSSEWKERHQI